MSYINAIDEFIDFYFNKHFQTHIYNSETSDEDNYSDDCLISSYNDEEDWNNWGDDCELLIYDDDEDWNVDIKNYMWGLYY